MTNPTYEHLIKILNEESIPLKDNDYASLIEQIGESRFVLLGEATHGTETFYQARIDISKRLIQEKGFMCIAIEGDWPDAYSIHRYIQGAGDPHDNEKSLDSFKRFPKWMWRNHTVAQFLSWLRHHNDLLQEKEKIAFYGLDLYSFDDSMQAVINYLSKVDPEAAINAKARYACFDHMSVDPQEYGLLCAQGLREPCTKAVLQNLLDIYQHHFDYIKKDGLAAEETFFYAAQNARVVKNGEHYYRSMYENHASSWNNRDSHMAETVDHIVDHLEKRHGKPAKIIIWAHNSHVGDARATEMGARGEINIGQLIREKYAESCYNIGFSTYDGTVLAANDWGANGEIKKINPGLEGSFEALFHDLAHDRFLLTLRGNQVLEYYLKTPRLQRAIGVIYAPHTERYSHYFFTQLPYQFDSIIHFDRTQAVKPI